MMLGPLSKAARLKRVSGRPSPDAPERCGVWAVVAREAC